MKKYTSGSFTATKYAIYKEDTDTITSFPAEIIADGENASALVSGNMQQTGTPTQAAPIYPAECGELVSSDYTIPIISGGVTTSINLSEVQTTRKIVKFVFNGTESWTKASSAKVFYITDEYNALNTANMISCMCSHYEPQVNVSTVSGVENLKCCFRSTAQTIYIRDDTFSSNTDFVTYLQQQYANGTPLTVWYVLAEPTTGILNEPLRKIGDYADTVTVTIPTVAAADNINVTTTLKPSAVDLTYTGWHKYDDKKRSGGDWT